MENSDFVRIPLGGGRAYLWKSRRSQYPHRAVITAHGAWVSDPYARAMAGNPFLIPLLCFYSRHGELVTDEGLIRYAQGRALPIERIMANQSYDYALSKYTNTSETSFFKHNQEGESYSNIEAILSSPPRNVSAYVDRAFAFAQPMVTAGPTQANTFRAAMAMNINRSVSPEFPTDIITISGRWFGFSTVRLSEILIWLAQAGYNYQEIHCSFCRA
jgi:hypothetical protein